MPKNTLVSSVELDVVPVTAGTNWLAALADKGYRISSEVIFNTSQSHLIRLLATGDKLMLAQKWDTVETNEFQDPSPAEARILVDLEEAGALATPLPATVHALGRQDSQAAVKTADTVPDDGDALLLSGFAEARRRFEQGQVERGVIRHVSDSVQAAGQKPVTRAPRPQRSI